MGTPPKANGRYTKDAARSAQMATGKAMGILYKALGSSDPVAYAHAIGQTLAELQAAHNELETIIDVCELAAVRGSYNDG